MGRAFIPNKIFSCSLILGTSVHEKTWQIGPTVLPLKLDDITHIKTRASGALTPVPIYGDVTSRVKKKFEEIMEANMWLSDLLLDRVANKTGVQSKFLGGRGGGWGGGSSESCLKWGGGGSSRDLSKNILK